MKLVGIIGPYFSGGDRRLIDHNIANARALTQAIANRFGESELVGFFCPHSNTARFEREAEAPESYYHTLDDTLYGRACEGFVLLPKWEESSGSRRDRERAIAKRRLVFELKSWSEEDMNVLLGQLEEWASEESC